MYQRILVPFDGSPTSQQGLDEAVRLAKLTGAKLRLLHVVNERTYAAGFETYAAYSVDVIAMMKEGGEKILAQGVAQTAGSGLAVDTALVENFAQRLCDIVAEQTSEWKADLIVIGTHGRRGVQRLLLGSDAELILRTAAVPVLLVRATAVAPNAGAG
jgi:nucleotide-binding universal stress UspA family protein